MGWKKQARTQKTPLTTFDLLEKRHHVVKYIKGKIPPKQHIETALWKAWKTTPSKNNAVPYKVFVYGPKKHKEKELVHKMVFENHKQAERNAVKRGEATRTEGGIPNPYYEHIKYNPYLITIHSRLATPNRFYAKKVEEGHFYDQAYENYIERIVDSVAAEVGIFAANLTNYLLEEDLDMSYNSCFKRNVKEWHKVGLDMIKHRPILMMTIGYAERYRIQDLKDRGIEDWDIKPPTRDIIKWI